jgi:phosphate transport system substrate-binding protein
MDSIPGMIAFLTEFTSDKAWGEEGYLSDKGLIPMPELERAAFAMAVKTNKSMVLK